MTTYAEKADIAAKAVKVLDSVTMRRHKVSAKNYAQLAIKKLLKCRDEHGSGMFYGYRTKASPAIEQIDMALESMIKRLDKPRYTLKDGEWVRKWSPEQKGVGAKAGAGHSHYMMAQREALIRQSNDIAMMQANTNRAMYCPQFGPV